MNLSLRTNGMPLDTDTEKTVINDLLPELIDISSNPIRAGIVHLLVNSPNTGHAMKVEELAYRLGTYHRVILHHLERLADWDVIEVRVSRSYGQKTKRSVWGLKLKYPNWIFEVYNSMKDGFGDTELRKLTTKNKSVRKTYGKASTGSGSRARPARMANTRKAKS